MTGCHFLRSVEGDHVSLGLPDQSARLAVSRALNHAAHVAAAIALISALVIGIALRSAVSGAVLWPALLALVVMVLVLWLSEVRPSPCICALYLLIGGGGLYVYSFIALSQERIQISSDSFGLALPKIALILVGGATVGVGAALVWATAGYLVGEAATVLATVQTGGALRLDATALSVYLIVCALLVSLGLTRRRNRMAQPSINRAEQDEQVESVRSKLELESIALMHDTALNHLAAIAGSASDVLTARFAAQLAQDVEILKGGDWLEGGFPIADASASAEWRSGALSGIISEARSQGLLVDVTGDLTVVDRLSRPIATTLAAAVQQCLVNVITHAGTDRAEIAVYGSADGVAVMVIDNGRGFELQGVPADRLGIRNSVRGRIDAVGGSVQVWSTLGRGTSIMLQVPAIAERLPAGAELLSDTVPG